MKFRLVLLVALLAAGCAAPQAPEPVSSMPSPTPVMIDEDTSAAEDAPVENTPTPLPLQPVVSTPVEPVSVDLNDAEFTNAEAASPEPRHSPRVVTLEDDQAAVILKVGDGFSLELGAGYEWMVTVVDETVIAAVEDGGPYAEGTQGVFVAQQPGKTELTATGNPLCRNEQPPCMMPSLLFSIMVVVE